MHGLRQGGFGRQQGEGGQQGEREEAGGAAGARFVKSLPAMSASVVTLPGPVVCGMPPRTAAGI